MEKNRILFLFFVLPWFLGEISCVSVYANSDQSIEIDQRRRAHEKMTMKINEQWGLLRQAMRMEEQRKFAEAKPIYEKLYKEWETSSIQGMAEVGLINVYEELGIYQNALVLVEHMLQVNKIPETVGKYQATKSRLLKKIEEQKKQVPNTAKTHQSFNGSSYDQQRQFIESMKTQGVATTFKEVMLLEHASKFADARKVYEKLLLQREAIAQEMALENWVMLYPAIQRTSELTGDEKREKEALVWIKTNMLDPQGQFHQSLSNLMPNVIDHLNEQIKKYQL